MSSHRSCRMRQRPSANGWVERSAASSVFLRFLKKISRDCENLPNSPHSTPCIRPLPDVQSCSLRSLSVSLTAPTDLLERFSSLPLFFRFSRLRNFFIQGCCGGGGRLRREEGGRPSPLGPPGCSGGGFFFSVPGFSPWPAPPG